MKTVNFYLCCAFFLLFNLLAGDVVAQTFKATGKVMSSDGRPLELVTVSVKESGEASVTNAL